MSSVMSGETTTITPVSVAERSQSQQNGELTAPENLVTRMMGRTCCFESHERLSYDSL